MNMNRIKRYLLNALTALCLVFAMSVMISLPSQITVAAEETAETTPSPEPEKELLITVVEDIPAEDIEEEKVPLAASPDTPGRNGTEHLLMGIVLLLGSVFYTVYFYHADQKLFTLRREAAEAELAYTRKAGDDHEC